MPCSDSFQVVIARIGLCLLFLFGLSQSVAGQSPTITSIQPDRASVGQIPAKVVLKGTGFEASSVVVINTTPVAAKIKSSGKKIVIKDLPAEFFQTSGVLEIKVIPATGLESNSIRLTVGSLDTIQLDASTELVVNVGTTVTLRAQVLDAQGAPLPDAVITYSSLTPDQATVDQAGVVTGIQTGAATIRLTSGEAIRDLVVTVTDVASIPSGIVGDGDIKVDSQNRVYATDLRRHIIRSAPVGQPLAEFAGAADLPGNIDGALTSSRFNGPLGLGLGNNSQFVYLADTANQSDALIVTPELSKRLLVWLMWRQWRVSIPGDHVGSSKPNLGNSTSQMLITMSCGKFGSAPQLKFQFLLERLASQGFWMALETTRCLMGRKIWLAGHSKVFWS